MTFAFGDAEWPGLAKAVEESGELAEVLAEQLLARAIGRFQQTAGKLMMTHGDPVHWSGNLRQRFIEELADLRAAAAFASVHCLSPVEQDVVHMRMNDKLAKFALWHADADADRPALP